MNTKCPICQSELESGFLRSCGLPYFLPEGERPVRLHTQKEIQQKNAVEILPEETGDICQWPKACICRRCQMIFVPYREV